MTCFFLAGTYTFRAYSPYWLWLKNYWEAGFNVHDCCLNSVNLNPGHSTLIIILDSKQQATNQPTNQRKVVDGGTLLAGEPKVALIASQS
jgi:hypothetical protein